MTSLDYPGMLPGDERIALEERLDGYRAVVAAQLSDLDEGEASLQPLRATKLTVGGVVKHLAWVEDRWFQGKLLGRDLPEPWASAPLTAERDWPMVSAASDSVQALLDLYEAAWARSRAASAGCRSLDVRAVIPSFGVGPVNLRWLLVHMVDETARHAGHVDLLRDALGKPPIG